MADKKHKEPYACCDQVERSREYYSRFFSTEAYEGREERRNISPGWATLEQHQNIREVDVPAEALSQQPSPCEGQLQLFGGQQMEVWRKTPNLAIIQVQ